MPSPAIKAEMVIQNANIITIDPRQPRAQALAIRHGRLPE
jgi:predicted amidohydrolase YtcJ